ncbi:MAG: BamA/TamA family outer membrane protein, partial [Alphaproteobacteria bacterium]|nr:BamA/TamA family outer membrane protein [Alphaproteobacteria bacterium]
QLSGGLGYSETYKFTLQGNYTDANFVGTGERISVNLEGGIYNKVYSIAQTNPYSSIDNLVRTISFTFRDVSQFTSASSQFSTKIFTTGLSYSYPISEFQFVSLGATANYDQLVTVQGSSAIQAENWVKDNGNPYHSVLTGLIYDPTTASYISSAAVDVFGTKFATGQLIAGWSYDSRNKTIFADRGMRQTLSVSSTLPVGTVRYWKANYEFIKYIPLWRTWRLTANVLLGYGAAFGRTTALPPFEDFYGGGPDSVRGFRESRLGPKDQYGNPYGGNMNVLGRLELIPPMPEKFAASARVSFFYDIGNVFSTTNNKVQFYAPPNGTFNGTGAFGTLGPPTTYGFSYDNLKRSVGVAVQWLAPLGLFRFSLGFPLNAGHECDLSVPGGCGRGGPTWGDETERFQFSIGQAF